MRQDRMVSRKKKCGGKLLCLLLIALVVSSTGSAQNSGLVYGNLGVENVNISIVNTLYGTSTDARGHYELPVFDRTKTINLYYSCIGYLDTIVSLTPRQLLRDSINISFKMRKQDYELQGVDITGGRDFYRSKSGVSIADIAFVDGKILVLENNKGSSSLLMLNEEGEEVSRSDCDSLFAEIFVDCWNDVILLGEFDCQQVNYDKSRQFTKVTSFSRALFRERLQNLLFEFSDAYVFRSFTREKYDYYIHPDHGQSQTYFYVAKDDSLHQKRVILKFIDEENVMVCQSYYQEIISEYYRAVPELVNIIELGGWDGNLMRLNENMKLARLIGWYCNIQAAEYHTVALKFDDFIQFIDLERYEIVKVGRDFRIADRRGLQIASGEKYFKNQFLTDEVTGITYGLFVKDGINYLGPYDPTQARVSMGQRASNGIYPRAFKVHGGYAYSVFFDSERNRGFINRVKIN